jgi:hypothetical protein
MIIDELFEAPQPCPECGGISFSDLILAEKKDACYYKVKASAKVWPSAYASGRLVQCRKKGAGNYGNKSEGVAEMDKSQTPPGRDGSTDSDAGKKEYTAKPTTAKKVAKDAEKILNKELNKKPGIAEGKADYNFDIEDLKRLERIRDLATLKAQALALISKPSAKPMKPEKVEWFKNALERMNSPMKVIKLMYDLLLSGEGNAVVGTRSSMNPNSYRQRFGEQGMAEGSLEEIDRRGFLKGLGAAAVAGAAGSAMAKRNNKLDDPMAVYLIAWCYGVSRWFQMWSPSHFKKFPFKEVYNITHNIELLQAEEDSERGNLGFEKWKVATEKGQKDARSYLKQYQDLGPGQMAESYLFDIYEKLKVYYSKLNNILSMKESVEQGVTEAPGAETLGHNQSTVASNEKAFDLEEGKPREKEADYGDDYQDMVARVKKLAGMGPLKTVYDPQKRVYRNVPTAVQPPKK